MKPDIIQDDPKLLLDGLRRWFADNRRHRVRWGRVTQENTAHRIGVAHPTLSGWLRGKQDPEFMRDESLRKIKAFLKENRA